MILLSPEESSISAVAESVVFSRALLLILFRQKDPKWWFEWNINIATFMAKIVAYGLLLRDEYPSTDDEQGVHVDTPSLYHHLPLTKWSLSTPCYTRSLGGHRGVYCLVYHSAS